MMRWQHIESVSAPICIQHDMRIKISTWFINLTDFAASFLFMLKLNILPGMVHSHLLHQITLPWILLLNQILNHRRLCTLPCWNRNRLRVHLNQMVFITSLGLVPTEVIMPDSSAGRRQKRHMFGVNCHKLRCSNNLCNFFRLY